MKKILLLFVLASLNWACKTTQQIAQKPSINTLIDTSGILKNSFTGMALTDLEGNSIFERNADRYFTPASNTKLFTLFASLKTLGDSLPSLRFVKKGDSLIFWGTGDPTTLHPDFQNAAAIKFLKSRKEKLFYSNTNFTSPYFGSGWSWDDYNDSYSPELSGLPLYGNIVRFQVKEKQAAINPSIFKSSFSLNKTTANDYVTRTQHDNQFEIPATILQTTDYEQDIPFKTSAALTQQLLMDTLKRNVNLIQMAVPTNAQTIFGVKADTVYRKLMQESDNMLAEHLMLLCGSTLRDSANTHFAIEQITEKYLKNLPDAPRWVDGSGLSRYNLFTPRTMAALCRELAKTRPLTEIYELLAAGGKSGTLKGLYKADKPFVFAKSGSLSGVYNLSGFIETKSGKTLVFSMMHNNFTHGASKIRKETERILTWVRENY